MNSPTQAVFSEKRLGIEGVVQWTSISELPQPAQANQKCTMSAAQKRPIETVFPRPWSGVEFMRKMPSTQ
jgi:hypothetical protein